MNEFKPGMIVEGISKGAESYERPFAFVLEVVHDGCFIGSMMAGGKIAGVFSEWEIKCAEVSVYEKRKESIDAMRNYAQNFYDSNVIKAIENIHNAIAAGKIPHITLK